MGKEPVHEPSVHKASSNDRFLPDRTPPGLIYGAATVLGVLWGLISIGSMLGENPWPTDRWVHLLLYGLLAPFWISMLIESSPFARALQLDAASLAIAAGVGCAWLIATALLVAGALVRLARTSRSEFERAVPN